MTHSKRCILRGPCTLADSPSCNAICPSFIATMGHSGSGGRIGYANVPADYRMLTLQTSPARVDQAKAYALIESYVKTFTRQFDEDGQRVKSLYLVSQSPGTGKTTTAAAVLNEWIIVNYIGSLRRNWQASERPAVFVDVNAHQALFLGFNRSNVPQSTAEPLAAQYYRQESYAKTAPFAVLDDIGVRSASEAFRADLHGIINARVTNRLPTCYTSNVTIAELAGVFDARLADRIRDMTVEITFEGGSRRGMRK